MRMFLRVCMPHLFTSPQMSGLLKQPYVHRGTEPPVKKGVAGA